MNNFKKTSGFTLVELIVVIAILGILAAVAIPAYSGYITKANEAADITQLDAVKTAAQAALATKGEVTKVVIEGTTVTATADGTEYELTDADTFGATDFSTFCDIEAIKLTSTTYKDGATWTAAQAEKAAVADDPDTPEDETAAAVPAQEAKWSAS